MADENGRISIVLADDLPEREAEILRLVALGHTSRAELVRYALDHGLVA